MKYQIIQPPFTLKFRDMSKKELKDYNEWFLKSIPERIEILTEAVRSAEGHQSWEPDFSPKSLEALGEWFARRVATRQLSEQEIQEVLDLQEPFKVGTQNWTLSIESRSLAIDVGMYLSQVFLKNHSLVKWTQPLGKKRTPNHGEPILIGFGPLSINPVRMGLSLANGIVWRSKNGASLRELYDIWSAKIAVTGT